MRENAKKPASVYITVQLYKVYNIFMNMKKKHYHKEGIKTFKKIWQKDI